MPENGLYHLQTQTEFLKAGGYGAPQVVDTPRLYGN